MILEIERDNLKTIKCISVRLPQPRQTFFQHLAQMGRAFLVNLRRKV